MAGAFDASDNGILIYHSGGNLRMTQLLWAMPGKAETQPLMLASVAESFGALRLSPDGRRLLVAIGEPRASLWMYDFSRGMKTRLTFSGGSISTDSPMAWSPDGSLMAFTASATGDSFYIKDVLGAKQPEEVWRAPALSGYRFVTDWSPDGKYLLFRNAQNAARPQLWILPVRGDRVPRPYLQPTALDGRFSPDGKWVAYESDETGQSEIYVTSFPEAKGKWQLSTDGGFEPHWSRDGKNVVYRKGNELVAVSVIERPGEIEIGTSRSYLKTVRGFAGLRWGATWDLAPDGRVLINASVSEGESQNLTLLVNWMTGLKR